MVAATGSRLAFAAAIAVSILATPATAQTPPQVGASPYAVPIAFPAGEVPYPPYTITRYDENYSYLRDTTKRIEPSDRFKFLPLGNDAGNYATLGVDARLRYDRYDGYPLDPARREHGGYLLERVMPYADVHLGDHFRVFGQLISAWQEGAHPAPVVPFQQVKLDVDQLFGDLIVGRPDSLSATVRVGRQELDYGAGRLIAPREGPNVRQPFDAARILLAAGGWQADLIYARPVQLTDHLGVFDYKSPTRQQLYGVYATRTGPLAGLLDQEGLDLYYLGYRNDDARFDATPGSENRHTFGGRAYGSSRVWQYDIEAIGQVGSFAARDIRAWAVSALAGHLLNADGTVPIGLTLGVDVDSGNHDRSKRQLQTFNPLFPRAQYFTEAGFFGPSNLISLHPAINLHPAKTIAVAVDALAFWRESILDPAYNPALIPIATTGSRDRYIGTQTGLQLAWTPQRHVSFVIYYAHLFAGPYLRSATRDDADYVTSYVNLHF